MKKLLLGAAMMISFVSFSFAQTATTKEKKQTTHKTVVASSKTTHPKAEVKSTTTTKVTTVPASKTTVAKLKKDGTPDKRYKASKKAK
jgi:hypothetical protein